MLRDARLLFSIDLIQKHYNLNKLDITCISWKVLTYDLANLSQENISHLDNCLIKFLSHYFTPVLYRRETWCLKEFEAWKR